MNAEIEINNVLSEVASVLLWCAKQPVNSGSDWTRALVHVCYGPREDFVSKCKEKKRGRSSLFLEGSRQKRKAAASG